MAERKKYELWALCVLVPSLLVLFSLISFSSSDLTFFNASSTLNRAPSNWVGSPGANVSWFLLYLLGIGAYGIPLAGLWLSWRLFRGTPPDHHLQVQLLGIALLVIISTAMASLHIPNIRLFGQHIVTGGQIGSILSTFLVSKLYPLGAHILLGGTFFIALLIATPFSFRSSFDAANKTLRKFVGGFRSFVEKTRSFRNKKAGTPKRAAPASIRSTIGSSRSSKAEKSGQPPIEAPQKTEGDELAASTGERPGGRYTLPTLELFDTYESENQKPDWKKLEENARVLEQKLADFGVHGKVSGIRPGPVITMYEYSPAPGVKISRIVNLSDDLSMALKATSIRVVAPIPGKAAIGIELPNRKRELVSIKMILESDVFASSPFPLTIVLGQDITGQPVATNLAKMPHLLIAGATGTGKSVCINTILSSLLYRNSPDNLRLLLIDPKRIELNSYEGIPHLIHPVVNDAKMATRALRWAIKEMEMRYRILAEKNARNIESYNRIILRDKSKVSKKQNETILEDTQLQHGHLPYVVLIIDELADLMMIASREVEESITRLAQMARAAGIHLILATQRPSVDVLTGIIKANIPTRISFQVSSRIDSRTILDATGAESLLGAGDMLFLPPGTAKIQRIHGAFISEMEVTRLTRFWRAQTKEQDRLRMKVDLEEPSGLEELNDNDIDEKYEEAVRLVLETRQASISMLQRRLRVGYNRAARMIEIMEQQGIVGPSDGVKPREVLGGRVS